MTHALTYAVTICLALSYCCAVSVQPAGPQRPGPGTRPALSVEQSERERTEQMDRERALKELGNQYREVCKTLMGSLEQAAKEHRGDRRYMSPLHFAIAAVEGWRVLEAEDRLLSIIDYELDVSSLPVGDLVGSDFLFPAVGALVKLRVDARKVTNAIAQADNDRQVQLLTWVLYQRAGSVEEAKRILESEKGDPHVATAIRMLDRGPDLLLRLPKAATAPAATRHVPLADQEDRERALMDLGAQYREVRQTLMTRLQEAIKQNRDDQRYMSPLFCAIAAVEGWRVFEAEAQLFSVIDYELDVSSLPEGIEVGGDYFYPAARALVKLRVEARKVTRAVAQADNERQIRLLTWVLYQRAGSIEEAKRILESDKDDPHVAMAIGMLDRDPDLLLRLPKAATAPAAMQRSAKPAFQSYEMSTARPEPLDPARLDRISDGMTLAAIVDELGPGWMSPDSGAGIITWFFDNGRHLMVWPSRYEPSEIITRKGVSGRSRMWIGTDTSRQLPATNPAATQRWVTSQPPVIGALGIPLGTVAEIRASVVAGSETGTKQHDGSYLLRVTEVDGRPIAAAPVLEFSIRPFVQVKLANNDFGLYELKTGTKAGELDSVEIRKLQKGCVGKQVRLVVYETGGYSGIPSNLPKDVMAWSDRGFGFSTSLVVLAERP